MRRFEWISAFTKHDNSKGTGCQGVFTLQVIRMETRESNREENSRAALSSREESAARDVLACYGVRLNWPEWRRWWRQDSMVLRGRGPCLRGGPGLMSGMQNSGSGIRTVARNSPLGNTPKARISPLSVM